MSLTNTEIKEFELELFKLYPHLPQWEVEEIISTMLDYWTYIIESID